MRAVFLDETGLRVTDVPQPALPEGWARIRVRLAGICGTDLELGAGYRAFGAGVPGHEFVGVVDEAPDTPGLVGRRVVGDINVTCGACAACADGRRTHCESRTVLGIAGVSGAFAEELVLPVGNLHRVPESLSDEEAVFAEPLAAAGRVRTQLGDVRDETAVVLGAGRLGLLCAQVLAHAGADVSVVTRPSTRPGVMAALGLRAAGDADGADIVVDATGSANGVTTALQYVRPGGRLVAKSTCAGAASVLGGDHLNTLVVGEITLIGSRCGSIVDALALLSSGAVAVLPLIEATYDLEDGIEAFQHAARRGALKVLLSAR